jgi:hypothetical protein
LLASTSHNDLNNELYDFIALALRAFVNPWWTRITRYDKQLLPHITLILTHVLRELESRLASADLSVFVFNDLPLLITQHYVDYRNAASKAGTSYANGGAISLPALFHQMQPHMAISSDGSLNDEYYRQAFDHILRSCLPEEDSEPETERAIIREVLLKVLVHDVIPKVTQPWFINKLILDFFPQEEHKADPPPSTPVTPSKSPPPSSHPFSVHTFIIVLLSAIQSISGFALALVHASKRARHTISQVNRSPPFSVAQPLPRLRSHSFASSLATQGPSAHSSKTSSTSSFHPPSPHSDEFEIPEEYDFIRPSLSMVSQVFTTDERLASSTLMHVTSALSVAFSPFLHRLLPYSLTNGLSPQFVTNLVRMGKRTLFPNGYPAPAPPDPTAEEQAEMRARVLALKPNGVPALLAPLLLGSDPKSTLSLAIEPFSSQPCNVHLVVIILDRVLTILFPELCT